MRERLKHYFQEYTFTDPISRTGYLISRGAIVGCLAISVGLLNRHVSGSSYDGSDLFRAVMGTLSAAVIALPFYVHMNTGLRTKIASRERGMLEIVLVAILTSNGLGALGFYRSLQYYDLVLHFCIPIAFGFGTSVVLRGIYTKWSALRVAVIACVITFVCIFAWEGYELLGDTLFGTAMLGQEGEELDTLYDIGAGIVALPFLYTIARKRNR